MIMEQSANYQHMGTWAYEDYRVDVIRNYEEYTYEAWLYEKNTGVKTFMLGMAVKDVDFLDFLEYVDNELHDDIEIYAEDIELLEEARSEEFYR